ncbi:MAG: fatty acid--CoA ligase [Desulfobacteraceae bacterium]|nr:fatty acid--CoA ligase [Desulfobacteraceae bacterium]
MKTRIIEPDHFVHRYPLLIKHLLETPIIYAPYQQIIYRDSICYTYSDLAGRVAQLANALESMGVTAGQTVGVMDWDSHRYLECFFAVPMMGAVLHTINVHFSKDQLVYTINHAQDDVLIANADFLPLLEAVRDKINTVKKIILINDSREHLSTLLKLDAEYETLLADNPEAYTFPDFDENSLATVFYTAGTTGGPKGVFYSHRQIVLHTFCVMAALSGFSSQANISSADVYMPITPMFHVHAWGMPYLMTHLGARQVYPGRYEPDMLLHLKTKEKVTFSHCAPDILHMLINCEAAKKTDFSDWKMIIGGSVLSKGLCRSAMQLGVNLFTGYGMSETCPVLCISNLKPHMSDWSQSEQIDMRCRTGLPISHVQLKVLNEHGRSVAWDGKTTGEIVVRAPWLTSGYFNDFEKSSELWEKGWLHTGDIGFIDEDGYLQITDRLKDAIKSGSEWISSVQLENIVSEHPSVSQAAVIGVPDDKWGQRPLLIVVLKPEFRDKTSEQDFKDFFLEYIQNGKLSKFAVPDKIVFTESLAKTSEGKVNKRALRRQYIC